MPAAQTLPVREVMAAKLTSLLNKSGVRAVQCYGTVKVFGSVRYLEVVCDDSSIGIICDRKATMSHESIPSGLTYAQIAAHIAQVAQSHEAKKIGDFAEYVR